jgi:hypothetical protein
MHLTFIGIKNSQTPMGGLNYSGKPLRSLNVIAQKVEKKLKGNKTHSAARRFNKQFKFY